MLSTKQPLRLGDLRKHHQVWPVVLPAGPVLSGNYNCPGHIFMVLAKAEE